MNEKTLWLKSTYKEAFNGVMFSKEVPEYFSSEKNFVI